MVSQLIKRYEYFMSVLCDEDQYLNSVVISHHHKMDSICQCYCVADLIGLIKLLHVNMYIETIRLFALEMSKLQPFSIGGYCSLKHHKKTKSKIINI
jgi:hypothetical protein